MKAIKSILFYFLLVSFCLAFWIAVWKFVDNLYNPPVKVKSIASLPVITESGKWIIGYYPKKDLLCVTELGSTSVSWKSNCVRLNEHYLTSTLSPQSGKEE